MARSEITLGPLLDPAKYFGAVALGVMTFISVLSGAIESGNTYPVENLINSQIEDDPEGNVLTLKSIFFAEASQFSLNEDQCYYRVPYKEMIVSFEEWHGYRFTNTFAWFFGLSQEPTYHQLGRLPVYEAVSCELTKKELALNFGEFMQERYDSYMMLNNGADYKNAIETIEDEGKLVTNIVQLPQP